MALHAELMVASITKTDITIGPAQAATLFQLIEALEIAEKAAPNEWLRGKLDEYHRMEVK